MAGAQGAVSETARAGGGCGVPCSRRGCRDGQMRECYWRFGGSKEGGAGGTAEDEAGDQEARDVPDHAKQGSRPAKPTLQPVDHQIDHSRQSQSGHFWQLLNPEAEGDPTE